MKKVKYYLTGIAALSMYFLLIIDIIAPWVYTYKAIHSNFSSSEIFAAFLILFVISIFFYIPLMLGIDLCLTRREGYKWN